MEWCVLLFWACLALAFSGCSVAFFLHAGRVAMHGVMRSRVVIFLMDFIVVWFVFLGI